MTAPVLAVLDQLDQLDQARAKATPGPWQVSPDWQWGIAAVGEVIASAELPADAACIVAEHNALPQLTAALRAVLDLIDPEAELATGNGYDSTRLFSEQQIRDAITEAIGVPS